LKKLFEVYDTNKNGQIDYTEFAAILFERPEPKAVPKVEVKKYEPPVYSLNLSL